MTKLLPLDRWKKKVQPEREAFSDDDSDEEDEEEVEQIVIPRSKRKLQADAPKAKRAKPNPMKRIPKKQEPRQIPMSELPKKRPRASQVVPGPTGRPPKRFKANTVTAYPCKLTDATLCLQPF